MKIDPALKYTENDEWVRLEGATATVGISDYAQEQLSDIVFVEITAAVGQTLEKGAAFATIESVKAAAEAYMPAAGKVTAVNEELAAAPERINADAYGAAWMIRFEPADPAALDGLMDAAAYEKHCQERSH